MKSMITALVALGLFAGSISPTFGGDGVILINAPIDHGFKFGVRKKPNQSHPQTTWICQTPGFWCTYFTPSFVGAPCCCWSGGVCVPGVTIG